MDCTLLKRMLRILWVFEDHILQAFNFTYIFPHLLHRQPDFHQKRETWPSYEEKNIYIC